MILMQSEAKMWGKKCVWLSNNKKQHVLFCLICILNRRPVVWKIGQEVSGSFTPWVHYWYAAVAACRQLGSSVACFMITVKKQQASAKTAVHARLTSSHEAWTLASRFSSVKKSRRFRKLKPRDRNKLPGSRVELKNMPNKPTRWNWTLTGWPPPHPSVSFH